MSPARRFILYLLKFGFFFCLFYLGTKAFIGITTPGNFYVGFADRHLDFVDGLRNIILSASSVVLEVFGYNTFSSGPYLLGISGGGMIRMVYSCIGFGVMSFWAAFVLANEGSWKGKLKWIAGGLFALWVINVARISFLLVTLHHQRQMPFGLDHHTWFNIVAYALIILMIWMYDREGARLKPVSIVKELRNENVPGKLSIIVKDSITKAK